jgi:hypothetical protein
MMDLKMVVPAMKDGLRHATIADPTAVRELALDLAEIAVLERGRKESDPPRAAKAMLRAARAMVRLRRRFNKVPGLDNDESRCSDDAPVSAHYVEDVTADGEEFVHFDEVGLWVLLLLWFEEKDGGLLLGDFRPWFRVWREQVLTGNGGGR